MTDCIRRKRSVWTTCPCPDCHTDRIRMHKRHRLAGNYRIPNDVAWAILANRIDADWTARAIGSATGLGPHYFTTHLAQYRKGRRLYLGPSLAEAIVNIGRPTEGQVGVEPSRRRLRALAVIGHGLNTITEHAGINFSTLAAIRNDSSRRCGAATANLISDTYDQLHMTPGSDTQAQRLAREKGWAGPLSFDDIDDLSEIPEAPRPLNQRSAHDRSNVLKDLIRDGANIHQACRELNTNRGALEKWCVRHEMSGLYLTLTARAGRTGNQYAEEAVA